LPYVWHYYGVAGLPLNGGAGICSIRGRNSLFLLMGQKGRATTSRPFLSIDSFCAPVPLFSDNRPGRWFGEWRLLCSVRGERADRCATPCNLTISAPIEPSNTYGFRNDVKYHLQDSIFPANDPDSERIREAALNAANHFFREVRDILVKRGVIELKDFTL
jgi:hypothetical protein